MASRPPGVSSARTLSSWLIVLGGLAVYVIALVGLGSARLRFELPWPWWVLQAAPVVVYGILVFIVARPRPFQFLAGVALLWVAHLGVGTLTSVLLSLIDPGATALAWVFPPPPLPQLIWVPLLLLPLRAALRDDPRPRRVRAPLPHDRRPVPERRISPAAAPVPPRAQRTPRAAAQGRMAAPAPAPAVTAMDIRPETARRPEPPRTVAPEPAPVATEPIPGPEPIPDDVLAPEIAASTAESAANAAADPVDALLARDSSDEPLRVSFDRVASQLPASMFTVPMDRVAAEVAEPGRLLIDRRLALAQLETGAVRATWQAVADQFPAHLLAATAEEISAALPANGYLVLPIDEIVRQLPPELFMPAGAEPDVRGIEEFPPPFQPLSTGEMATSPESGADMSDVEGRSAVDEHASAYQAEEEPRDEWRNAQQDSRDGWPDAERDTRDDWQDAERNSREEWRDLDGDAESEPAALYAADAPDLQMPSVRPASLLAASRGAPRELTRILWRLLPPVGPFEIEETSIRGVTLVSASASGLGQEFASTAARLLVPLLATSDASWPVEQVTLRGAEAAVVLTPVGSVRDGGVVVAATVVPGGSLALLEMRCRQTAADAAGRPAPERADDAAEQDEPDLLDVECSTRVRGIASMLDALGPVTASTLRDAHADRALYLFLPAGSDVRTVGALAQKVSHALEQAADAGVAFRVAVLRGPGGCLVIRPPAGAPARFPTIVAAGQTARPGLAYRQVERAAVALGAP